MLKSAYLRRLKNRYLNMRRLFITPILVLSTLLFSCQPPGQRETAPQRILRHISQLASEEMAGRFPGTRGDTLAAHYIRDALLEYGYQPLAEDGLQPFALTLTRASQQTENDTIDDPTQRNAIQGARQVHSFNVVMSLFGAVDSLRETIVIGAHYDHLGMGGMGSGSRKPNEYTVHYGADDNASGVVGMMEVAQKLSIHKEGLKRNVVVAAFGAEEQGILGSKEFVRNRVEGVGKIVMMINLDMIGRMDTLQKLHIGGVGTFEGGEPFIHALPNRDSLVVNLSKEGYGPSDHAAFYGSGIPVLYFNTGVHTDYHSPTDHVDKIEAKRMAAICDYIFEVVYQIATAPQAPLFQKAGPSEAPQRASFNVSLGIIPDFTSTDSTGLRADFITDGRPAEKAGMLPGDVIKFINGVEVFNVYDYMERLRELKAGELVTVQVRRKEELITLKVQL
jgi:hypothetical protein